MCSEHSGLSTFFVVSHFLIAKVSPEWRLNLGFGFQKSVPFAWIEESFNRGNKIQRLCEHFSGNTFCLPWTEVSLETSFPKGEVTLYSDASVIMALISLKKANLRLFIRSTSLICISCDQKPTNKRQCIEKTKLLCSSRSDTVFTRISAAVLVNFSRLKCGAFSRTAFIWTWTWLRIVLTTI